ncbi:MAG: LuxR C-terminal-related transcriptional regulator [Bacteroidota bacterium]
MDSFDIYKEIFYSNKDFGGTVIEKHINKYQEIDNIYPSDNSFFIIINTNKFKYEFISKNFKQVLGYDVKTIKNGGPNLFISLIHPEDLRVWLNVVSELFNFEIKKELTNINKKLLYSYNFRLLNSLKKYLNVIAHLTPIEYGNDGKPVIAISHYTVIDEGKEYPITGSIKFLNDNDVYETLYYKNFSHDNLTSKLTKREIDIIQELALNKSSKEIARRLFISQHTVDQHRRNILKKLDFKSTGELVQYCKTNNFF